MKLKSQLDSRLASSSLYHVKVPEPESQFVLPTVLLVNLRAN